MSTKKEHTVKKILAEKMEELKASQNVRLDDIEKFVRGELAKINDRNKAINGYVVNSNSGMQQALYNLELTNEALELLITEANLVEGLKDKLAAKRGEIHEQRQKQAEEQMKARMESEAKPEAPAAETAAAVPAPQEEVSQEQVQAQG